LSHGVLDPIEELDALYEADPADDVDEIDATDLPGQAPRRRMLVGVKA
jgi:hypothetical protein